MKEDEIFKEKKGESGPVRTISEFEKQYLEEMDLYDKVLKTTILISLNQHGIQTDGRGLRGVRIFTRQTLLGISFQRILPRPSILKDRERELWDICSIASLARNIIEGYLSLYYFGIEKVSDEEAELRFLIAQLHRNVEWWAIRRLNDPDDPTLKGFEETITSQRERIEKHVYLSCLTVTQRKRALRGVEMYMTKRDFEKRLKICTGLSRNYRLLSNLVHPLPISIERIDNERGRGVGNDADVNYSKICLMLARRFLAASTVSMADHFPDALANKFRSSLNEIRPLMSVGF